MTQNIRRSGNREAHVPHEADGATDHSSCTATDRVIAATADAWEPPLAVPSHLVDLPVPAETRVDRAHHERIRSALAVAAERRTRVPERSPVEETVPDLLSSLP
jgi:hypothetical protein